MPDEKIRLTVIKTESGRHEGIVAHGLLFAEQDEHGAIAQWPASLEYFDGEQWRAIPVRFVDPLGNETPPCN